MSDVEKGSIAYRGNQGEGNFASTSPQTTFVQTAPQLRVLGNPGPLGLYSFASTTFILSMYNVQARGVAVPNVVVGMALFVGGLAQLLAGMWEYACGNTFGATAFSSYGGFWLSYAALLIPGTGIGEAYAATPSEEPNAIGIFLAAWFIISFLFLLGSLRINFGLIALFVFLDITFMLLMIGAFTGMVSVTKAGGGTGIVTAFIAYYCGTAQLVDKTLIPLPLGIIKKRED